MFSEKRACGSTHSGFHAIGFMNRTRASNASTDRGATPTIWYVSPSIRIGLPRTPGSSWKWDSQNDCVSTITLSSPQRLFFTVKNWPMTGFTPSMSNMSAVQYAHSILSADPSSPTIAVVIPQRPTPS